MHETLIAALRCPVCRSPLTLSASTDGRRVGAQFGVLGCGRHEYPVIDGIPVLRLGRVDVQDQMDGRTEVVGPSVEDLVAMVRGRQPIEALVALLAFPPALPVGLEGVPVLRLPLTRGPGSRALLRTRRRLVRGLLQGDLTRQTAQQWMRLCYLQTRNVNRELYPYFFARFGQPRHIASLALTSILRPSGLPVLDLACGFGHIMHNFSARAEPLAAVGMDRNFFQLWVASRFVAPRAQYVCADAATQLPFAEGSFAASVCTDAFHLLPDKPARMADLRRCSQQGTVIIDRVGNRMMEPRDVDTELTPQGYLDLAASTTVRMVGQRELVQGYLDGRGPRLANNRPPASFDNEKWLSLVISDDASLFTDHQSFDRLPHAEGPLGINPVYRGTVHPWGVKLRFEFPSTWYAFENAGMLAYSAAGVRLSHDQFRSAREGQRSEELVGTFVQIGMPERYAEPLQVPAVTG